MGVDPPGAQRRRRGRPRAWASGTCWRCRQPGRRWAECSDGLPTAVALRARGRRYGRRPCPPASIRVCPSSSGPASSPSAPTGATTALEPAGLMAESLRLAEADSGGRGLLAAADSLRTISELSWRYRNPALAVADRLGARPRRTSPPPSWAATSWAWSSPGPPPRSRPASSTWCSCAAARPPGRGRASEPTGSSPTGPCRATTSTRPSRIGIDRPLVSEVESARGVRLPVQVYPLFEVALRARLGLGVDAHRARHRPAVVGVLGGRGHQPPRLDPAGPLPGGDHRAGRRQPDDLVPVHEAPLLEQPGRPGLGPDPVLGRGGRAGRGAA